MADELRDMLDKLTADFMEKQAAHIDAYCRAFIAETGVAISDCVLEQQWSRSDEALHANVAWKLRVKSEQERHWEKVAKENGRMPAPDPDAACTCYLEPRFSAVGDGGYDEPVTNEDTVLDAEGEVVCRTKKPEHARLVAWALNRASNQRHECCVLHGDRKAGE